ncbi:MAG: hypothetical protein RI953_60 [Pseudomonadota bacterium]|jgi:hypothetical protein
MQFNLKNSKHTAVHFALIATTSLFAIACSAISAKKPTPKTLVVPSQPSGTGFGLSGETPSGLYRGGLLIWSSEVKSQQIEQLLKATRETNEKYVALSRYFGSFQEKEIQPLKRTIEEKRVLFSRSKVESDERSATAQSQKASVWYAQEMDAVKQRFPAFDVSRADGIFQAYCEAKIVDLATRSFLPNINFRSRPTPSAICETYYAGRFFTGESCASDAQGRSYYQCVWEEGVLKTRFAERLQIKTASTASGTKVSTPVSLSEFAKLENIKKALALEDVPYCTVSLLRSKILSGVKFKILANGNITGGFGCGENSRFEISYGAGEWDKDLASTTAGSMIDSVESKWGTGTIPAPFQWIAPEIATSAPDLASAVQASVSKIAMFQSSVASCSSEFNSPNDVYFNDAKLTDGVSLQGQCKSMMPPLASIPNIVVVDEQLELQRQELNSLERDLANLKGNACPVAPSCEGVSAGHARCDFLNAQVKKAAAAEARGVAAVLLTDFALSFEKATPSSSTVVVWMNNAPVGVGCLGEAKLGACTGSNPGQALSSAVPLQADISANNELILKMRIDSRQLSAAGVPESVARQFLAFNENVLELNASINSLDGMIPYLSGKAFIRSDENSAKAIAEGSVSYLIENSFDRKLGEFCSAQ